jgi:hypothetical protein
MTKTQKKEKENAITLLKELIQNDKIAINITNISQSGMSRRMKVYTGDFKDITYFVGLVCELSENNKGLLVSGCGMDMAFWLTYNLTYALYPNKEDTKHLTGNGGGCLEWKVL